MSKLEKPPVVVGDDRNRLNDCWNKIGVRGDRSCEELEQHVHCRNCPVYARAAMRLLDAEGAFEQDDALVSHYAEAVRVDTNTDLESVLIFRLGAEWFALPTVDFVEVTSVRPIHALPHRRNAAVMGLANVRGTLLVGISLGILLGLEGAGETASAREAKLLVMKGDSGRVVFPVDAVWGVNRVQPSQFKAVPATVGKAAATYTKAVLDWGDKTVGMLDSELLFHTINRSLT